MSKLVSSIVILASSVAAAGTLHGDKAATLTYALRYAGASPTTAKAVHTFQAASIDCTETLDRGGGMSDYRCTLGTIEVKDAAAYLLYTAVHAAGTPERPITETQIQVSSKHVSCVQDPAKGFDERFTCTGDGFIEPVTITPKKTTAKDIVQPVKIEKQH